MNQLFLIVWRKEYFGILGNMKRLILTSTKSFDHIGFIVVKIRLLLKGYFVLIVEIELIADQ